MGRAQRGTHRATAVRLAVLVALVVPFTTGCSVADVLRFGWPAGVTPQADAMRELWIWSAVAALVVGAITWGAMFWAVVFHRKRKDDDGTPPRQTQYNLPVEIAFTVIPTIIVAVLFGYTVTVQNYVDTTSAEPEVYVGIRAFQWNWEFVHLDPASTPEERELAFDNIFDDPGAPDSPAVLARTLGDSDTIPILVLPVGVAIEFEQRATDVIHSFFVPEFLFKRDVFPMPDVNDQDNVWQIDQIDQEGAFVGRCAELCGSYHSQMNFEVRALPQDLYDQWLALRQEGMTTGEALAELGCGQLCAPESYTTYPFTTERTQRDAAVPASEGN